MSKVVLLAINSKYVHSSLAVWVIAGGVFRHAHMSHDVKVVEATIHQTNGEIVEKITAFAPDIVGISTYIWNAAKLPELLGLLKEKLPKITLVLGGPEAANNSEYWLAHGADHVLRSEGEFSFPPLLDSLSGIKHVAAELGYPSEPINPYSEDYFSRLDGRIAYLETSRGCPFRCLFCLSGGSGVVFFPMDTVKEWIYKLSRSGTQTVKLVDRTFNCNAERAHELFEYIMKLDTNCRFHFEVAADLFDDRTLSLLSRAPAGRIQLEAGFQSFYEPALKATFRQTDIEKAENNVKYLLRDGNIHMHIDLIAGLPYETMPVFQDGFDRAFMLGAHTLQLGFLKLLHGSALRSQAKQLGIQYNPHPPYEITRSPWLSTEDLRILKEAENALQHTYNKSRFLSALRYALSVSGLRPFELFRLLGNTAPNHGAHLADYARQIYDCFTKLPNVREDILLDCMVCDWLGMVKGKNMPQFMRNTDHKRKQLNKIAENSLGHGFARDETATLRSGVGVYVDSHDRAPVTGLYRLHFVETW